ncbi:MULTISPECIES: putative holin-like toxin [Lactobacillus]|uniref:putative holin-like toxin n=1 Tax=Lactobacillus TaxID=1578 RepID=UPI0027DA7B36|nr:MULTISPECIES: putative holin-like toxin [Lactobacillus]MDU1020985.1 putative holin-like toxin [Lactobacillus paragasseri]MDX5116907.1 putative holin-like toxin [Lactobacillus paragasseri]MDX5144690.1 putative holin-like toxin [Lactobacillus paragasseri]
MSVYESISLMLLFGTFLLALLTYIDHHKKQKRRSTYITLASYRASFSTFFYNVDHRS